VAQLVGLFGASEDADGVIQYLHINSFVFVVDQRNIDVFNVANLKILEVRGIVLFYVLEHVQH
jgi:hypothetical protein